MHYFFLFKRCSVVIVVTRIFLYWVILFAARRTGTGDLGPLVTLTPTCGAVGAQGCSRSEYRNAVFLDVAVGVHSARSADSAASVAAKTPAQPPRRRGGAKQVS